MRTQYDPQNLHGAAAGTVSVQAPTCSAQTFAYEESIQDDRVTVTIDTDRLFEPVDYLWTLNGQALASSGNLAVIGGNGETVLKFTQTVTTALPPPNGTAIAGHAVELRYRLSGASRGPDSRLVLNARSQDANYDVRVEVRATDALGRHFSDAVNLKLVGDIVEFGDDYEEYLDKCLKATADIVNKKGRTKSKVKVGDPRENWRDLVTAFTHRFTKATLKPER